MPGRGLSDLYAEAAALLKETAALLAESMELAAAMQKQLRAYGVEPSGEYTDLLARYSAFVGRTDV